MDLPEIASNAGAQEMDYDMTRRAQHVEGNRHHFIYRVLEIAKADKLTAHQSRPHSERDLRDFAKLGEGDNSREAMRRGVEFEFPYDKSTFKDRYTRQHRDRPCSTIVAHLSKDGLMFIHPTQQRSLTPREAGRVQTFPDWFKFPVTRTHQYRVIGNAVPPLVGEAVGAAVANFLRTAELVESGRNEKIIAFSTPSTIPLNQAEAFDRLAAIGSMTGTQLRKADKKTFLEGWHALLYMFPGLHPDNAFDHGDEEETLDVASEESIDLSRRYLRSGWPVVLEPFGREAWRRYDRAEINENEFYCLAAQQSGFKARQSERAIS
jgi:DNA (cytosine-5)-methyltransferase 1